MDIFLVHVYEGFFGAWNHWVYVFFNLTRYSLSEVFGPIFNFSHRVTVFPSLPPHLHSVGHSCLSFGCELVPYCCFNFFSLIVIKLVTFLYVYVPFGLLGKDSSRCSDYGLCPLGQPQGQLSHTCIGHGVMLTTYHQGWGSHDLAVSYS